MQVVSEGANCLKLAASDRPPDLILLDIMMADLDGYEVCRKLKANPATSNIPVIFLTARTGIEDEQQGLRLPAGPGG